MLLTDKRIRALCTGPRPMIHPFSEAVKGGVSYGLTSAGYDLRMSQSVWAFKAVPYTVVDPKLFGDGEYRRRVFETWEVAPGDTVVIEPHGYLLTMSLERIRMPADVKGRCVGKSTYARCGIIVNTTPLEPEWEGHLTIEISNSNPCPVRLYPGEGVAQLEFELLTEVPESTYASKGGKYQGQTDITPPRTL